MGEDIKDAPATAMNFVSFITKALGLRNFKSTEGTPVPCQTRKSLIKEDKMKTKIGIDGMNCMHCAKNVTDKLNGIENILSTVVNLKEKNAVVESNNPVDEVLVIRAIVEAGYRVTGIEVQ